jgi:hypothetical protein
MDFTFRCRLGPSLTPLSAALQVGVRAIAEDIGAAFADDLTPLATGNSPAAGKNYETFFCSLEEAFFC